MTDAVLIEELKRLRAALEAREKEIERLRAVLRDLQRGSEAHDDCGCTFSRGVDTIIDAALKGPTT